MKTQIAAVKFQQPSRAFLTGCCSAIRIRGEMPVLRGGEMSAEIIFSATGRLTHFRASYRKGRLQGL